MSEGFVSAWAPGERSGGVRIRVLVFGSAP